MLQIREENFFKLRFLYLFIFIFFHFSLYITIFFIVCFVGINVFFLILLLSVFHFVLFTTTKISYRQLKYNYDTVYQPETAFDSSIHIIGFN